MAKSTKKSRARTRQERSAGVVVYRIDPSARGGRLFLLLDYGRHWDYAKGHVKSGESDRQAALRELAEETGIVELEMVPDFTETIDYFFQHPKRGLVHKTVVFYLGRTDAKKIQLSDEHVGYAWAAGEEALQKLTFETARRVMRKAIDFLQQADPK